MQEKGDQECQKSDFHQRKEADILFEKREEPFNIYEFLLAKDIDMEM